jgi:undecaprenyl-diphosphatase
VGNSLEKLMRVLDTTLFQLLTAGAQAPGWLVFTASVMASAVVPLVTLGLLLAWIKGRSRFALLDAVVAGLLGLGLVQVIGALAYRPRPFEVGLGLNLMDHAPENSFPSDHATLMFSLAVSLALSPLRIFGLCLLPLGLAVGWGRVYLGAHFPFDILGGAVLGAVCALVVKAIPERKGLWSLTERVYMRALGWLF